MLNFPSASFPVMFRRNVYRTANRFSLLLSSANHSITAFPWSSRVILSRSCLLVIDKHDLA
jgi:hypothetical protein